MTRTPRAFKVSLGEFAGSERATIIFLAESGEESATEVGIDFMVEKHFDAIDAEFALTEGGGVTIEDGKVTAVTVSTERETSASG